MSLSASMLGALRCFDVAARHCNFTRAAEALHITPGAVSQTIRQLETQLSVPLFVRLPRGLALTDAGRRLHAVVSAHLAGLSEAVARISATPNTLRVTCSPSFAMMWLMPRMARFHRDHPDIEIKLVAEFQRVDRHEMLASGTDCAIRYDPVDYDEIHAMTLMPETLIPVASPQLIAAHAPLKGRALLAACTLLHDAAPWDGATPDIEWQTWLAQVFPDWDGGQAGGASQEFNLSMLSLMAARSHQGIAMGRRALVAEDLQAGSLVDVSAGAAVTSPGRYVLLTTSDDDARVAAFSTWLAAECARFSRTTS
ncbi:LysR substrate-binding domain-containing protein [Alcaligenaceae bacterium A4P071]|nr:LysR substrate-binding domain-containing protein [Alcaligenaceae bacterium B3P038]MDQ2184219.1 LysR substrate-binding domain-containing protein [Alcaligenaceae bacterium A4P071]